jgi:hypothetical protein
MSVTSAAGESPPVQAPPRDPTGSELLEAVQDYLHGKNLSAISLRTLRGELEKRFGLAAGELLHRKDDIRNFAVEYAQALYRSGHTRVPSSRAATLQHRPLQAGDSSRPAAKVARIGGLVRDSEMINWASLGPPAAQILAQSLGRRVTEAPENGNRSR